MRERRSGERERAADHREQDATRVLTRKSVIDGSPFGSVNGQEKAGGGARGACTCGPTVRAGHQAARRRRHGCCEQRPRRQRARSSANVRRIQATTCRAGGDAARRRRTTEPVSIGSRSRWTGPTTALQPVPAEPRAPVEIGLEQARPRTTSTASTSAALTASVRAHGSEPARRARAARAAHVRARRAPRASRPRPRASPSASATSVEHRQRGPARPVLEHARGRARRERIRDACARAARRARRTRPSEQLAADGSSHLQGKGRRQDAAVHLALQEQPPCARHGKQDADAQLPRPWSRFRSRASGRARSCSRSCPAAQTCVWK